jgi:nicotinamide-nucleotide amidase
MNTADIISIGDEILIGQITNTNASFIATQLNILGIKVRKIVTVADNEVEIISAVEESFSHSNLIFLTGGLGPTNDDITKNTLCNLYNSELIINEEALADITALADSRGITVSELNYQQAAVPHNCSAIRNTEGTAPGMWFQKNNIHLFSMPGVPFEMKKMFIDEIIPILSKTGFVNHNIFHRTILTMGMGESALAEFIKDWETGLPEYIKLAYLPEPGIVKLRLSSYTISKKIAEVEIDLQFKKLRLLIPDLIFGENKITLQEVVGDLLKKYGKTISTAESCTGGFLSHLITSVPGSSQYYKGSVIAYANEIKTKLLHVDEKVILKNGAVSGEVVIEMAKAVKKISDTDYSIAISGIAGPDGGTEEKPVGTIWIAVSTPFGTISQKFMLGKDRERNIKRAALFGLNMLRLQILNKSQA